MCLLSNSITAKAIIMIKIVPEVGRSGLNNYSPPMFSRESMDTSNVKKSNAQKNAPLPSINMFILVTPCDKNEKKLPAYSFTILKFESASN